MSVRAGIRHYFFVQKHNNKSPNTKWAGGLNPLTSLLSMLVLTFIRVPPTQFNAFSFKNLVKCDAHHRQFINAKVVGSFTDSKHQISVHSHWTFDQLSS